jgi:SAM-dependent methyltransferase
LNPPDEGRARADSISLTSQRIAGNDGSFAKARRRDAWPLFLASFAALYFELVVIRYLSTEIRTFAYLKNVALIASFFGIGLGMVMGKPPAKLKRFFPLIAAAIFLLTAFASPLHLTHVTPPMSGYVLAGDSLQVAQGRWHAVLEFLAIVEYLVVIPGMMYLVVGFFVVLGGIVGEFLAVEAPLRGYGINLAGSLAGILVFTLISFLGLPPAMWVLIGFAVAVPFFIRDRVALAAFAAIAGAIALAQPGAYWSPYYRISVEKLAPPAGWQSPSAFFVDVNHDYHQKMLDLSPEFMARFPDVEPNHSGFGTYEFPYKVVPNPRRVRVVGAGTGNDVAAALRHGAAHVDAVEIDPVILKIGRKYHPERPYDSPRVTIYNDDARAFFKKTVQRYDLIVFGYLDSHTLLTSLSSVRLDNYVYTVESFREARRLLTPDGTLVLSFSAGGSFIGARMYAMLDQAFDAPPVAYFTGYDSTGVVYVEGSSSRAVVVPEFTDVSQQYQTDESDGIAVATDHWPFLYLESRSIPFSILAVLLLFLYFSVAVLRRNVPLRGLTKRQDLHLFFLGAGFMLLETKGVTELSLLFGSTWVVNAVVIGSFLLMGLLANAVISFATISRKLAYAGLFCLLIADMFLSYTILSGLSSGEKTAAGALLVGLPVFFSGMIFSRSFKDVSEPAHGLGVNLLGAVAGGVLENLVMIGGTPILGILAIVLYGASAVAIGARAYSTNLSTVGQAAESEQER